MQIEREEVVFDRWGQWQHSHIRALGPEWDDIPFNEVPWFAGIETHAIRIFDLDTIEYLHGDGKQADFRRWQPEPPEGDDWFPFAYGEDEESPYVLYARPSPQTKCRECQTPLTDENVVRYDETFAVCKDCEANTSADWKTLNAELKAEGFDTDKCTYIEDVLAADAMKAMRRIQRAEDDCGVLYDDMMDGDLI